MIAKHKRSKAGADSLQSVEHSRIENEIATLCNSTQVRKINVLDPTFNFDPTWTHYVLSLFHKYMSLSLSGPRKQKHASLSAPHKLRLSLQCRLEYITPQFLQQIASLSSDCHMQVLLEFGIQTTVKQEMQLIQRFNNLKKIERHLSMLNAMCSECSECSEDDLQYEVSLIYGLPSQTLQTFQHSIEWCQRPMEGSGSGTRGKLIAYPLMILRGTALDQEVFASSTALWNVTCCRTKCFKL